MIGVDTCAIIDLFKGNESVKKLFSDIDESIASTYINFLELMFGLDFNNLKHKSEEEFYNEYFLSIKIFNLSRESCKQASIILSQLEKQGRLIDEMDAAIAGIFLSNGVNKIITRNAKHYENIPGLKVISY